MKVPYGRELSITTATGALPDAGGVLDQEAPFVDGLGIVTTEIQRRIRRAPDGR